MADTLKLKCACGEPCNGDNNTPTEDNEYLFTCKCGLVGSAYVDENGEVTDTEGLFFEKKA